MSRLTFLEPRVLLQLVREGDPEAAATLVELYDGVIRRVIHRHLDAAARPLLDTSVVVQEVWTTFHSEELYREAPESPEALREFLCGLARNTTLGLSRRHRAQVRDRRRDVPLEWVNVEQEPALIDPRPGPACRAEEDDLWDSLLRAFDETEQEVLRLRRCGETYENIAGRLGINRRTIRRIMEHAVERLEREMR
jgi:RNA polymerase sigma factor (sigma-70 family)